MENPYEILKLLILKPSEFRELPEKTKNDSFFMLNKIISQAFPEISNSFNSNGIYGATCLDFYSYIFEKKRVSKIPGWVFSKFASKHKKTPSLEKSFREYLYKKGFDKFEIQYMMENQEEELKKLKKEYEKRYE